MQTLLCNLVILIAALYVANQWLPYRVKRRVMQLCGKTAPQQSEASCNFCSSCKGCGKKREGNKVKNNAVSDGEGDKKNPKKLYAKVIFSRRQESS
ncbi:MAG: hypothetical protein K0R08_2146 [Solimicrobium sp.]|jgi:hypothetical protein|nr:hypothetical protein [Solimicrobium sp.]